MVIGSIEWKTATGQQALTQYQTLLVRKQELKKTMASRKSFCERHGIVLSTLVKEVRGENVTAPVSPQREIDFIHRMMSDHTQDGFTIVELLHEAQQAGFGDKNKKEVRTPFLVAIQGLKASGVLVEASWKRVDQTVLIKKQ